MKHVGDRPKSKLTVVNSALDGRAYTPAYIATVKCFSADRGHASRPDCQHHRHTTPDDYRLIKSLRPQRFDGERWVLISGTMAAR